MIVSIDCIVANTPTKNKRIYTHEVLESLVLQIKQQIGTSSCWCELGNFNNAGDMVVDAVNICAKISDVSLSDRLEIELEFNTVHKQFEKLLIDNKIQISPVIVASVYTEYDYTVIRNDIRFVKFVLTSTV